MEYFDCSPMHARLTTEACAARWKQSQDSRFLGRSCHGCAVGAQHARVDVQPAATRCCVRCGQTGSRLLRKALCMSCYNREREWRLGRNRKGSAPQPPKAGESRPPPPRWVGVLVAGVDATLFACSVAEAVVMSLRLRPRAAVMPAPRVRIQTRQLSLFSWGVEANG